MERRTDNSKMYKYGNGKKNPQLAWKCFGVQLFFHRPNQHSYWEAGRTNSVFLSFSAMNDLFSFVPTTVYAYTLASAHSTSETNLFQEWVKVGKTHGSLGGRSSSAVCVIKKKTKKLLAQHRWSEWSKHSGREHWKMDRDRRVGDVKKSKRRNTSQREKGRWWLQHRGNMLPS